MTSHARPVAVFDSECAPNYWLIGFREVGGKRRLRLFERTPEQRLDVQGVRNILRTWTIVGFNSNNYDCPMLAAALAGATNEGLKRCNDLIILGKVKPWQFYDQLKLRLPEYLDHVDLMEVSPGSPQKPSLKLYAGRMHSQRMQELPYDPDEELSHEQIAEVRDYHVNDLDVTADLYLELKPQIELRAHMSQQYGVDVRSKSDAQVAEAVIRTEIERRTGNRVYKPDSVEQRFRYVPPPYLRYETPELQCLFEDIKRANFILDSDGFVVPPPGLERKLEIAGRIYKFGIGGLHSTEKSQALQATDDLLLLDRDVTSYYPYVILGSRLYPKHLGSVFLEIYKDIYDKRIAAKKVGDKNTAETLKIVLNGSFGKFGSAFSTLYSPKSMIQVTITGQLAVLMLIERIERVAEWSKMPMHVVSANTDGVVTQVPSKYRKEVFEKLVKTWEYETGFQTEETCYTALYSRDVNNYIGLTVDGKVKAKGTFTASGRGLPGAAGMKKNPDADIVTAAVTAYLKDGTPVEQTIIGCTDIRQFLTVRRVNGGAMQDGQHVGKAIRWYIAVGSGSAIHSVVNGNTVPRTEGAQLCLDLPRHFPIDVDYDFYIRDAYATLEELGIEAVDPNFVGRTGTTYARLIDQVTVHMVRLPGGLALCGKAASGLREPWVEVDFLRSPRVCRKCLEYSSLL